MKADLKQCESVIRVTSTFRMGIEPPARCKNPTTQIISDKTESMGLCDECIHQFFKRNRSEDFKVRPLKRRPRAKAKARTAKKS